MSEILDQFERFRVLFENLKTVAGEPQRLIVFYSESSAIRDAAESLTECACELEYDAFWYGPKRFASLRAGFEREWDDYQERWAPAIAYGSFCELCRKAEPAFDFRKLTPYSPELGRGLMFRPREQEKPDPVQDDFFDPRRHNGGLALTLGIDHRRSEVHRAKVVANKSEIALGALD